jgi:hypothetical protein
VGASNQHANGIDDSGAAYIYNVHTGAEIHKLMLAMGGDDYFGTFRSHFR